MTLTSDATSGQFPLSEWFKRHLIPFLQVIFKILNLKTIKSLSDTILTINQIRFKIGHGFK